MISSGSTTSEPALRDLVPSFTAELYFRAREAGARADRRSMPQPSDDPRVDGTFILGHRPRTRRGVPRPLRILLVGSLARVALGVVFHDLSLGGHLARRLARDLGRPVELTIRSSESSIANTGPLLRGLGGYDVVLLVLGDRELGERRRPTVVQRDLALLLEQLASEPAAITTFVVGLPAAGVTPAFGTDVSRGIRKSAGTIELNAALEAATVTVGSATWVPFAPCPWADAARDRSRVRSSGTYDRWAALIAPAIVAGLAVDPLFPSRTKDGTAALTRF